METAHRSTVGQPVRRWAVVGLVAAMVPLVAFGSSSDADAAPPTEIDLSTYVRVGRYPLPEPLLTPAPPGSVLAQEVSAVTYNPDTDTLFVVGDRGTSIVQVSTTGVLIDSMTLATGSSPQGSEFYDPEGLTYVGGGQFVLAEERDRQAVRFTYAAGTTLNRSAAQTVDLGGFVDNIGTEGITYDPFSGGFVAVKEVSPLGIFQTDIDFDNGTNSNGSATTEPTDLFDPALLGLSDFGDVYSLSNLPSLAGQPQESHLLVLSQEAGKIVNVDRAGNVSSSLTIVTDLADTLAAPEQQHEGLTMDEDGNLYVVSENGGGSIDRPELWVYAPSTAPNAAPSAVTLTNASTSILENTNTASRVKVARVFVTDDGLGTNDLAVTGPDAASFEVDSNGLYLKAGSIVDFETTTSYTVSVVVDDAAVGGTPDATSTPYTLNVTDVADEATDVVSFVVSEVSPSSSGNGTYGGDWFELTNTGTSVVNIDGWKVDDNSNGSPSTAQIALNGVTNIFPGQSVVFVEGTAATAAAFTAAWFGTTPPTGFAIGTYSGSGIGFSTGGDAVNVFNTLGERVTGVAFGAATTGVSFDNTVGVGSATIPLPVLSGLSVAGVNSAFVSANGLETGSPGTKATTLFVSEVAPWGSGDAPYAGDWFEITNFGATTVDLGGWKVDDSTNAPAAAVPLVGVGSIAPGQSAVFIEVPAANAATFDAAKAAAFIAAWFGGTAPDGFAIGTYGGSGVGLSTGGDAVYLFPPAAQRSATGVSFGSSTTDVTFDNAAAIAGPISTLSVVGVNGAFLSPAAETGSPGTTDPDVTAPSVAYVGNVSPYTIDQTVAITCAASDGIGGSGLASNTCADIAGPAAGFGIGTHTFDASATDNVGLTGTAETTVTVIATPTSLRNLTVTYVEGSARYLALNGRQQAVLDRTVTGTLNGLLMPLERPISPTAKRVVIGLYKLTVNSYASVGLLTRTQATQLVGFTAGL